jgi:hypothetical protein
LQEPSKPASNVIFEKFLAIPERHELVACGHPATAPTTSPADDINRMRNKLGEILARAAGIGA